HSQVVTTVQGTPGTLIKQDIPPLQTHTQAVAGAAQPIVSKYNLFTDTAALPLGGAAAAVIDPTVAPLQTFVEGVCQTLTGTSPGSATIQAGVAQLQSGMSRQEFVYDVMNSQAHLSGVVNNVYQAVLNRAPSAQELVSGIAQISGAPAIG